MDWNSLSTVAIPGLMVMLMKRRGGGRESVEGVAKQPSVRNEGCAEPAEPVRR
jgi:hypothetical protein